MGEMTTLIPAGWNDDGWQYAVRVALEEHPPTVSSVHVLEPHGALVMESDPRFMAQVKCAIDELEATALLLYDAGDPQQAVRKVGIAGALRRWWGLRYIREVKNRVRRERVRTFPPSVDAKAVQR